MRWISDARYHSGGDLLGEIRRRRIGSGAHDEDGKRGGKIVVNMVVLNCSFCKFLRFSRYTMMARAIDSQILESSRGMKSAQ